MPGAVVGSGYSGEQDKQAKSMWCIGGDGEEMSKQWRNKNNLPIMMLISAGKSIRWHWVVGTWVVVLWENKEVTSKWRPEGEAEAEREAGEAGKGNLGKGSMQVWRQWSWSQLDTFEVQQRVRVAGTEWLGEGAEVRLKVKEVRALATMDRSSILFNLQCKVSGQVLAQKGIDSSTHQAQGSHSALWPAVGTLEYSLPTSLGLCLRLPYK